MMEGGGAYQVMDQEREAVWNGNERIVPGYWRSEFAWVSHSARYRWARGYIPSVVAGSVVDWGCGVGYGAEILNCPTYVGVDRSMTAIAYARTYYSQYGAFVLGDVSDPSITGSIGVCFECVEHLDDDPVRTVDRLLQVTPTLIFSVPFEEKPGNVHHRHFGVNESWFMALSSVRKCFQYQMPDGSITPWRSDEAKNLLAIFRS
jgi:SAM-dependent methyltransferase